MAWAEKIESSTAQEREESGGEGKAILKCIIDRLSEACFDTPRTNHGIPTATAKFISDAVSFPRLRPNRLRSACIRRRRAQMNQLDFSRQDLRDQCLIVTSFGPWGQIPAPDGMSTESYISADLMHDQGFGDPLSKLSRKVSRALGLRR